MKAAKDSARVKLNLPQPVTLLAWVVLLSLSASVAHAQQTAVPKRILVLYWYDQDYPGNVRFHQSFQAALQSAPSGTVGYYPEYLESNRFPGKNQSLLLHDYLRQKYADRIIDVVVASPDPPLNFLLRYRDDLFPTAPLVFSSVRRPSRDELAAGAGATGIIQLSTHRKTIDLALRLHPDTKQVLIIGGTLEHKKLETLAREALQGYESKVRFTYLTDLTSDELIAKTKSLPERSIILYVWQQSVNKNGKLLESADLLALIAQSAPVPIYGMGSSCLGYGIIGGYVSTTEATATRVAEIALRIANGERAQDIPIESAPAVPTFDWRQLQRWRISEDRLPPGSIVRFRQLTFWEHYKWYIIGVLALCALQALLISILLIERAHRRRAKVALDERLRFETLVSELSAELMSLPAHEVDHGIDEGLKRLGGFLGANDGAFLELSKSDVGVSQNESNSAVLGTPPLAGIPDEQRRWCMSKLRSGATVNLSCVAEVPPEEVSDGKSSGRTAFKSLLAIPMAANGSACALAFARAECYRDWPEGLIPRLRLAGEIFANALVRKKQEEALRESEERYRAFFELAAVGAGQASPDEGRFLRINEAHCRITGHTREELLALKFSDITHPEDREKDLEKFRRLIRGEAAEYTAEMRYLRKNGDSVWVQVNVSLVRDTQGRPLHTVAIVQDIDARKRAQQALAQSEDFNRRIIESSPDCMAILDLGGNLLYLNPRGQQLMEIDDFSTYRSSSWLNFWQGAGQQAADSAMQQARAGGAATFQAFCPTAAGTPKWWDVLITPMRDAQGGVERLLAVSRDITKSKRAEDALRESEGRFRVMADTAPVLIWLSGTDGLRTYLNRPWLEFTGRTMEQELGNGWAAGVHSDDYARCLSIYITAFEARRDFRMEYRLRRHDDQYRWVLDTGVPRFTPDGAFSGYIGSAIDITERIEAEAERKQAAEALRESEHRFRNVVETQTELICRSLPDTTLTFVNDAYCRYFKKTREELIGSKFIDFIPQPVQQQVLKHIEALLDHPDSETSEHEHEVKRPDGSIGWHHWVNRKIFDSSGQVIEVQGIGRDITARKLAEKKLRESEERYRNVVETQTELICRYECDTTLTFVNDAYCRYFGKTRAQLIGIKFLELIPEEARPMVVAHLESLIANPRIETDEHQVIRADGTIGWQQWVNYAIRDGDGIILEMQAIGRDITERKRLEQELEGREREFATLVENSPDVISRLDRNLRYLYISPIVERVLGVSPRQLLGKTTREIGAPPHDWDAFEASCRQALETGEIVDREFSYTGRQFHSRLIPEVGAGGSVDSLLCISEDITERRRSERELVQLSVRLLGLQEEERRRIGRQLHDVTAQNLFATTINLARVQSSSVNSETKEVLAECQTLCGQALQEIRTLSYLLHPPILDQVGLASALKWYIDGFAKRSGIDVGLIITQEFDRLSREMEADLFRIVQESLSNVHRHSGSSTASVRLEKQSTQVVLQIRDEGRGMQPRITPAEADESTLGVGIPGMRQRLRQLGGHLTIESDSQGTTVTATVPLHTERRRASPTGRGSGTATASEQNLGRFVNRPAAGRGKEHP